MVSILSMDSKIPYDKDSFSINLNNETYKKIANNVEQNFNFLKCCLLYTSDAADE